MATGSDRSPVVDVVMGMTASSLDATTLDDHTLMLVRIAALIASDAPRSSYLLNLGAAGELGVTVDEVEGILTGVAPIVGTARMMTAVGNIVRALGLAIELAELAEYADTDDDDD